MSLGTDNTSLSTASPLQTLGPPHCSLHQPPRLRYALGLFAFSNDQKKKKKTERGKDTSAQTKLGLWQLAYVLQKLVEWQRRLNLNVGEEQVTGLEETRKRREGRRTRLESYRFVIHC